MSAPQEIAPVDILLVEDNPGDVRLTERAFEEAELANDIHVVTDGVEAMQFLRCEGEYADAARPDIVLLDLDLPKKSGEAVLDDVKTDPELREIPVVVLSSSDAESDVEETYDRHANAYLTKPVDFDGFVDIVRKIDAFWFSVVTYPPG
jgi:Response regulator containing a CheY-like receiver domain and an HTH DNA-binding domain